MLSGLPLATPILYIEFERGEMPMDNMDNKNSFGKFGALGMKKDHVKYVNDYTTELYTDEKGKTREKTIYIGPLIYFREKAETVRTKLVISGVLALFIVFFAGYSATCEHTTAWWILTSLPMAIALVPCLYLLMGAGTYQYSAKPMQRDRYMHSIIRAYRSMGAITGLSAAEIIFEFVFRIKNKDWLFIRGDRLFLAAVVLAIVFCVLNIILLRSLDIDEREISEKDGQ